MLELLSQLAFWLNALLQLIVFIRYKAFDRAQKLIALVVTITLINHGLTWYLLSITRNNLWVYHLYTPLMFVIMSMIYAKELRSILDIRVFKWGTIGFVFLAVLNSVFIQGIESFNSNLVWLSGVVYICFSLAYFYKLLTEPTEPGLVKNPMIWFNSGVIIYYSGTLLLFLVVDVLVKGKDNLLIASWVLNALFNLLLLTSYGVALCMKSQE